MKPSLVDTDILSEFLRGNPKIIEKVEEYLNEYDSIE
jgi:tRNA(fMet)-specific endonuclease VapC